MAKTSYSATELKEFKILIQGKLKQAQESLVPLLEILSKKGNGTDDTGWTFNMMEDGAVTLSKEETTILAQRQEKFIMMLNHALTRIENKTYGICKVTGELIPRERLLAVPHATMSINQKQLKQAI